MEIFKKIMNLTLIGVHALLLVSLVSCSHRPYTWVEDIRLEKMPTQEEYHIGPGDQVRVSVWGQDQITGDHWVREDGSISIVLIGDIKIAGLTTEIAASKIAEQLEGDIVQNVHVNVSVTRAASKFITVIGEVSNPGKIELLNGDNIIDVISRCGYLTEFAHEDEIYLVRSIPKMRVIRFDLNKLTAYGNSGIHFKLHDGDIIIVD